MTHNKLDLWRTVRGVLRSMGIYYGNRARRTAMDQLYARFVQPGDLVFDIGAHVATGSLRSGASAPGWSQSSRNRRWCGP